MHYLLSHRTTYSYASSVDSAHHIAHLRARAFPGQTVTSIGLTTHPAPSMAVQHVDHFGNLIDIYAHRPAAPALRHRGARRGRGELSRAAAGRARRRRGRRSRTALSGNGFPKPIEASEFVHDLPLVPIDDALAAYGARSFTPGRPILEAARELTPRIKADFEYHPGATDISTPLARGVRRQGRRLPGLRPCDDRGAARARPRRGLCLGLHPHRPLGRGGGAARRRRQPRLGRGVVRRARPAGSISTRPTTWSRTRTTSPSPGAATSPT